MVVGRRDKADYYRYTAHPNGYHAAVRLSEDYASRARAEVDVDEPSIDTLQSLLLLGVAFTAAGKGKKAYMMLGAWKQLDESCQLLILSSERYWNGSSARITSGA